MQECQQKDKKILMDENRMARQLLDINELKNQNSRQARHIKVLEAQLEERDNERERAEMEEEEEEEYTRPIGPLAPGEEKKSSEERDSDDDGWDESDE